MTTARWTMRLAMGAVHRVFGRPHLRDGRGHLRGLGAPVVGAIVLTIVG